MTETPAERRIVLRCDGDASDAGWGAGLSCARAFYRDLPALEAGEEHGINYTFGDRLSVRCYWTTARTVVAVIREGT